MPLVGLPAARAAPWRPPSALPRRSPQPPRLQLRASGKDDNPFSALFNSGFAFLSGLLGSLFSLVEGLQEAQQQRKAPARIVQQLGAAPVDAQSGAPLYSLGPFPKCTEASDIRQPGRHFTIITTAALPWRTGPAINPLLRALHLARRGFEVTLVLPWLEPADQGPLFEEAFADQAAQEGYICTWCLEHADMDVHDLPLRFQWYEASYVRDVRSIFPKGDCSHELGEGPRDVLILEEPEHLCWYHNGQRWPELFRHVVGVVHTNYRIYLEKMGYEGLMSSPAVRDSIFLTFTSMVCSAYCDITVKVSDAGISLPNEVTCNIHGVRNEFFRIGDQGGGSNAAYFLGKAIFQKGWGELLDYLEAAGSRCADLCLDGFGSGPDFDAIHERALEVKRSGGADLRVSGGLDHSDARFHDYAVLVNPSTSDMLCTVTAEALAMCKRVVLPQHASNRFFAEHFPERCHLFEPGDGASFEAAVRAALKSGRPPALSPEARRLLSWDEAIERLCSSVQVRVLSGAYTRPSAVASSRIAYDLHRRIQSQESLTGLLKSATLKRTPWEEYMAKWKESEAGQFLLKEAERFSV